jgi:hypothetical protein
LQGQANINSPVAVLPESARAEFWGCHALGYLWTAENADLMTWLAQGNTHGCRAGSIEWLELACQDLPHPTRHWAVANRIVGIVMDIAESCMSPSLKPSNMQTRAGMPKVVITTSLAYDRSLLGLHLPPSQLERRGRLWRLGLVIRGLPSHLGSREAPRMEHLTVTAC